MCGLIYRDLRDILFAQAGEQRCDQPLLLVNRKNFSGLFDFSQRAHMRRIAHGSSRRKPDSVSSLELYF